jgi:hypothetical protein
MNMKHLRKVAAVLALLLPAAATLPASAGAVTYTYDALNRLTEVAYDNCDTIGYAYDAAGNITGIAATVSTATPGDYNADGNVDIADAILAMRVFSGARPTPVPDTRCTDVAGDNRVGVDDVIYILQRSAGIR